MDRLYRTVAQLSRFRVRRDDDFVDRMHYVYTAVILVLFSIIVSTRQYVGEPIVCWCPAHFTASHQRYTNNICWIANTYWLPMRNEIPEKIPEREDKQISYYQWVPFILLMQTIVFCIPCILWRTLNGKSGINIRSIVEIACDIQNLNPEHRAKCVRYLAHHLELCLDNLREYRTGWCVRTRQRAARACCLICGRRYGNYLVSMYILVKFVELINVTGQLVLLNRFLGAEPSDLYGVDIVNDFRMGRDWRTSGKFPRITMCDFQIRQLGNIHRHTVQCVLPINMFNEKVFLFLWFWYVFVSLITFLNLFKWISSTIFSETRVGYVLKYLKITGHFRKSENSLINRFVNHYLRPDGVFTLRVVAKNAGDLTVAEMIANLWVNYKGREKAHLDAVNDPSRHASEVETKIILGPGGHAVKAKVGGAAALAGLEKPTPNHVRASIAAINARGTFMAKDVKLK